MRPVLAGELCVDEGDGQAYQKHVDQETLEQCVEWIRPAGVVGAERKDDEIHHEIRGHSVEDSADEEVVAEEGKFEAGEAVDGGDGGGDEEVQEEAEEPGAEAAVAGLRAEQAAGDAAADAPSKSDKRGSDVEGAGDGATDEDGHENPSFVNRVGEGSNVGGRRHRFDYAAGAMAESLRIGSC
jgi:hypothetical protein